MGVRVVEFTSLDGVVQGPGYLGEDRDGGFVSGGWSRPYFAEHRELMTSVLEQSDALLLGRRTHELFAAAWPKITDPQDRLASRMNALPRYIVSSSQGLDGWTGSTVVGGDPSTAVSSVAAAHEGTVSILGSSALVRELLTLNLVDEIELWLHPVVLGYGKSIFPNEPLPTRLELIDVHRVGRLVGLRYGRADSRSSENA